MKLFFPVIVVSLILFAFGCSSETATTKVDPVDKIRSPVPLGTLSENSDIFPISELVAVEIARRHLKTETIAKEFVSCDGGLFWQVVYVKEKLEVAVSKTEGKVYSVNSLARNVFDERNIQNEMESPLNPQSAVDVATRHFNAYGREKYNSDENILDNYFATVCDLGEQWRIRFVINDIKNIKSKKDISNLPNHSPPDYVIEKKTGEIIYFSKLEVPRR